MAQSALQAGDRLFRRVPRKEGLTSMRIVVPVKQVPDLVEELEIAPDGKSLERDAVKYVLNEFDDHALEEALQLKEAHGGVEVVAATLDYGDADQVLYTCLAKGADRAIKVGGPFDEPPDSHATARLLADLLKEQAPDLVLVGVQAPDDLDGQVAPLLATYLGLPHVSVATRLELGADGRTLTVRQEYSGGLMAEFEADLPAVLGIQAARATPRYAPVSRVRQLMRSAPLEAVAAGMPAGNGSLAVERLFKPTSGARAEMLGDHVEEVAQAIVRLLRERGLVGV